jgi:hypothetical protein
MNRIISEELLTQLEFVLTVGCKPSEVVPLLNELSELRNAPLATTLDGVQRYTMADGEGVGGWVKFSDLANLHNAGQVGGDVEQYVSHKPDCEVLKGLGWGLCSCGLDKALKSLRTTQPQPVPSPGTNQIGADYDDGGFKIHTKDRGVILHLSLEEAGQLASQIGQPQPVQGVPTAEECYDAVISKMYNEDGMELSTKGIVSMVYNLLNRQEGR